MNNINTKINYIILLFFFLIFFFYGIVELFTVSDTFNDTSNNDQQRTTVSISTIDSVVLPVIESQDFIPNSSSSEYIKPISLRDDTEFQESIARMDELVEYSRNYNIYEKTTIKFDSFYNNTFDCELDPKLTDRRNLEIKQNINEVSFSNNLNNTSDINIVSQPFASVNVIDEKSDIVSDNFSDASDTNFDYLLEANQLSEAVFTDSDSDSDSELDNYQSDYLPSQRSVFEGMDISKMDSNTALKIFLDKTSGK